MKLLRTNQKSIMKPLITDNTQFFLTPDRDEHFQAKNGDFWAETKLIILSNLFTKVFFSNILGNVEQLSGMKKLGIKKLLTRGQLSCTFDYFSFFSDTKMEVKSLYVKLCFVMILVLNFEADNMTHILLPENQFRNGTPGVADHYITFLFDKVGLKVVNYTADVGLLVQTEEKEPIY